MFDSRDIDNYKMIKAPDRLRNKVMALEETGRSKVLYRRFIPAAVMVASLMLIAVISLFASNRPVLPTAYINGVEITSSGSSYTPVAQQTSYDVSAVSARETELKVDIPLKLELKGREARVSVSEGELRICNEINTSGRDALSLEKDAEIMWTIYDMDSSKNYEMYVKVKKNGYVITVACDEEGNIIIKRK